VDAEEEISRVVSESAENSRPVLECVCAGVLICDPSPALLLCAVYVVDRPFCLVADRACGSTRAPWCDSKCGHVPV
jgi:hypothetical protein